MRTYTQTVREGELLGPVDWSYSFPDHFSCFCLSTEDKADLIWERINSLWQVVRLYDKGIALEVMTSGFWHPLLAIGMYDGWPFWKPTPALLVRGPLGGQWDFYYELEDFRLRQ